MTHPGTSLRLVAACLLPAALGLAACGGGGGKKANSAAPAAPTGAVVNAKAAKLGTLLVGPSGRTLYLFEKDDKNESYCKGRCASAWPPLTTSGGAKAGSGASAGMLGTFKRDDGKTQVSYAGHPLYYYAGDSKAGDTNGEGLKQFGAEWYVLSPKGKKIENGGESSKSSGSSGSSSSGGSSSGSGY